MVIATWLTPTEDNATPKFPPTPVEIMSCVPNGLLTGLIMTVMLVAYTLNPTIAGVTANVTVDAITIAVLVDPFTFKDPASKLYTVFVERLLIVKVVFVPPTAPIELSAILKFALVPVETTICVPLGFPLDPIVIEALVV